MQVQQTLNLRAGTATSGRPVFEEILVEPVGVGFRVVQSPGLVVGLAADDVISVSEDGAFEVIKRGLNVCVQMFMQSDQESIEHYATGLFEQIGGRLDGKAPEVLVYTIRVDAGFASIEQIVGQVKARFAAVEWYYGNVYDPADGVTPLNWW